MKRLSDIVTPEELAEAVDSQSRPMTDEEKESLIPFYGIARARLGPAISAVVGNGAALDHHMASFMMALTWIQKAIRLREAKELAARS